MFLPNIINADLHLNKNIYNMLFKLQIDCCIKLSGMPDLTLSFMNPRLFDDVSFHPCVRFKRWEVRTSNSLNFIIALLIKFFFQSERILSFIPPDGNFRLLSYHIGSQSIVAIPIYVRHNISLKELGGGRLDITVGPKQTIGRTVRIIVYFQLYAKI